MIDGKETISNENYFLDLTPMKQMYLTVLFHIKDKAAVDDMTWEELNAMMYLISIGRGING